MPRAPAVCNTCGSIFPSGIELNNSVGISFVNIGAGPCPNCGGNGRILDGIYDALGSTLRALLVSNRSVRELESLRHMLKTAREQKAPREEIVDGIKAHAPELKNVADVLPQKRVELYMIVSILIAIISALIAAYGVFQKKGPTEAEIQAMVEKAVAQAYSPPKPTPTSQPRNRAERRARGRPTRHK